MLGDHEAGNVTKCASGGDGLDVHAALEALGEEAGDGGLAGGLDAVMATIRVSLAGMSSQRTLMGHAPHCPSERGVPPSR